MNFKYYFHGKISVSPKDSPGDYFTIEPRIECIIMPPLFMLGKKIPNTPDDEVIIEIISSQPIEDPIPIDPNIEFKPDFNFKFPDHE